MSPRVAGWFVVVAGASSACSSGPSLVPSTATSHFVEPPVVEHHTGTGALTLAFTQGSHPFFFLVTCEPAGGRLVCAVRGSSSSGNLAGRRVRRPIDAPSALAALRHGGAWFWEPSGTMTPLRVVEAPGGADGQ